MDNYLGKLQIYLITYNRKKKLVDTLESILSDTSPIRDFDITILDNASTDGSSELIEEYCSKYKNLKHIRHSVNIGGNANICRAFELSAACGKEYAWILCDDDKYDFSNWSEVEEKIDKENDLICVCDYAFPNQELKTNKAYQIMQMTFVPATIFKTNLITDTVLMNMYDSILTMFQQSCLTIHVINNMGKIEVLSKPIVHNGIHFEDKVDDESLAYTRGSDKKEILSRRKNTNWILGYSNIVSLLQDKKLRKECIEVAYPHKEIYKYWYNVYDCVHKDYFDISKLNFYYEIVISLPNKRKIELLAFLPVSIFKKIISGIFSLKNTKDKRQKVLTILGIKFFFNRKIKTT